MKTRFFIISIALFFVATLFFNSCKKDTISDEDITTSTQDDAIADNLFDDIDNQAQFNVNLDGKSMLDTIEFCVPDVTHVVDTTQTPIVHTVTLDFGYEGCEGRWGNVRKGKIIITQTGRFDVADSKRVITLDDFYFNDYLVEGTKTITCLGLNSDGHLEYNAKLVDGRVTTQGAIITREFDRTRKWLEGAETKRWIFDDKWEITGTTSGINRRGKEYKSQITTGLIIDMDCLYKLTKGVIEFTTEERTISLDYGDGTCDNDAIVTFDDGTTKTIKVRKNL